MKALKIIGIVVVAILAIVLVLGIIAPKEFGVERTVEINAPVDIVYAHVSNLKKLDSWSPWSKLDSNIIQTYAGNDGEVGSVAEWEGNEMVGKGRQEITALEPNKKVETKLNFYEPYESEADAYFNLEEGEGATKVTWGFGSKMPFPMNFMLLFQDMDAAIGKDFESGLEELKTACEQAAAEAEEAEFDIEQTDVAMKTYITVEDTVEWQNISQFFGESFGKAYQAVTTAGHEVTGAPSGLYYAWDEVNKSTYMAAGIPVMQGKKVKGFKSVDVGGKALKIAYYGSYEGSEAAHIALNQHIGENGLEINGPVLEEYITDPSQEPDTSKWLTNIYYFIK